MKKAVFGFFVFCSLAAVPAFAWAGHATYHIGPGDTLEISVWKDATLSRQVVVPPDSIISFPLIGDIDVGNMTVAKLRKTVAKKLSEYIPDATVTVMLVKIASLQAYVIGKVKRPGQFAITLDTDVMQILAMAGGMTPFASESNIIILRRQDNKITKIPFDYKEVEKGKNLAQNIILQRGDVVVVP